MRTVNVELSKKAVRFLIIALDAQVDEYRRRLASGAATEDEESDLNNDIAFLEGVRATLAEALGSG